VSAGLKFTGLHHFGVTVSDLTTSLRWYEDVLGWKGSRAGVNSGEEMSAALQLDDGEIAIGIVPLGDVFIELIECRRPTTGRHLPQSNADVGVAHLGIAVPDMNEAYDSLLARGAVFNSPPVTIRDGELSGARWAYFRDPDGNQIELWQHPTEEK
jgi:catechol 2,3-dioxygenase-like lactoylglutathione lyase family enzyme